MTLAPFITWRSLLSSVYFSTSSPSVLSPKTLRITSLLLTLVLFCCYLFKANSFPWTSSERNSAEIVFYYSCVLANCIDLDIMMWLARVKRGQGGAELQKFAPLFFPLQSFTTKSANNFPQLSSRAAKWANVKNNELIWASAQGSGRGSKAASSCKMSQLIKKSIWVDNHINSLIPTYPPTHAPFVRHHLIDLSNVCKRLSQALKSD